MSKQDFHLAVALHNSSHLFVVSEVKSRNNEKRPTSGKFLGFFNCKSIEKDLFADPIVQRLIVEMHVIFDKAKDMKKVSGKLNADETLNISRHYRSVIKGVADDDNLEDMHMRDFALWSLFETMFLKAGDTPICYDLIQWARDSFHFADIALQEASDEINNGMDVGHGSYWKAVILNLVCLKFDVCARLLSFMKKDPAVAIFLSHLEKFNEDWLLDVSAQPKFEAWKKEWNNIISYKHFSDNRNVAFLVRCLAGDDKVINRLGEKILLEWWHLMPFYVFTKCNTVPYNGLGPVAEDCRSLFESHSVDFEFDPFLAIFNLSEVSVLQTMLTNPWLGVHIIDTMFSTEAFDQPIHDIRSQLLMQYGSSLITNSCLWEIGCDYLLECGAAGKLRIESHILSMEIEDDVKAEKLYRLCEENFLEESRNCVINTMTNRHLRGKNWGAALSWALRDGKRKTIDTAVHQIVWNATESEIGNLAMLDHLDKLILSSPSLSFLFGYYRFHTTLQRGDVSAATTQLIPLVLSPDVPSSFHKVLFSHLMFLLGEVQDRVSISRDALFELVSFFKRYRCFDLETEEGEMNEEMMTSIQRLLIHRLASSLVTSH